MPKKTGGRSSASSLSSQASLQEYLLRLSLPDVDKWICVKCENPYFFKRIKAGLRGGPRHRSIDRRYGLGYCYRSCKSRQIFRHESTHKPSPQPEQDPQLPELIARLREAKKQGRKKGGAKSNKGRVSRVRDTDQE